MGRRHVWAAVVLLAMSRAALASAQTPATSVQWSHVVKQTMSFTALQHGVRLTEEKTRRELGGPFVRDWFDSAASLFIEPTWDDGGRFFTNYVAHPMEGSVYGYIYRQNDSSDPRMVIGAE